MTSSVTWRAAQSTGSARPVPQSAPPHRSSQHRGGTSGHDVHDYASWRESDDELEQQWHTPVSYDLGQQGAFEDFELRDDRLARGRGRSMLGMEAFREARSAIVASMDREPEAMLDAWYGEYGTTASRAVLMDPAQREAYVAEVIIGEDDRRRVPNPQEFPYRCICSLVVTARNGTRWVGTGWLAGPQTVITAGHCIYIHRQGGWARQIEVYPGRDGENRPYRAKAKALRSVRGWTQDQRPPQDYGAIVLDRPLGDEIGYFGYLSGTDDELAEALVNVIGYPADKRDDLKGTMWWHARQLSGLSANQLLYDVDTYGGNSGGPVILWEDNEYYVLGIHNYGDMAANKATRINRQVFENIRSWST